MALAKVNVTPSGDTSGGLGLPPIGLGQGGSGALVMPTKTSNINIIG